jgi:hypothetical protein
MTESSRHENSNAAIQELLKQIGATVLVNDQERGKNGYKFEPIWSEKHQKFIQYTADTLARMPGGAMVDFEVNFKYHNKMSDDEYRAAQLAKWFITVVPVTPSGVDAWKDDLELLKEEVAYWQKHRLGV